jgi:hypothetical protein
MCYNLLIFFFKKKKKIKIEMIKKKGRPNYLHFIDLEGQVSSAYVPVRDQNLVVRGKNWRLIGWVFFNVFEKGFEIKAKWQNGIGLYFLN